MQIEIVTPLGTKWKGEADVLTAPGSLGEFGVLPQHRALMSGLTVGQMTISGLADGPPGRDLVFVISGGYLQVMNDRVIVATEIAEGSEDLDPTEVHEGLLQAQNDFARATEPADSLEWELKRDVVKLFETRQKVAAMNR